MALPHFSRNSNGCLRNEHALQLWLLVSGRGTLDALISELKETERQIGLFLDRIAETTAYSVIGQYEKRIVGLEEQKILISEKIENCGRPVRGFDETLRTALEFLANPWNLWSSDRLEDKRAVLRLAFVERIAYARNEGFRTANFSLPFKVLSEVFDGKSKMVGLAGLEPATNRL